VIASILDNDLYKFTVQQVVLDRYPHSTATFEFIERSRQSPFTAEFAAALRTAIDDLAGLALGDDELQFLRRQCPYFKPAYLEYLRNYRFDPAEVRTQLDRECRLSLSIAGPWHRTTLWEVPLLAAISEVYFRHVDRNWTRDGQVEKIRRKSGVLRRGDCAVAEFGTRRRRDYDTQDRVVGELCPNPGFVGTSNVHLAQRHGVRPVGTVPHEFIMAQSVLAGLRHANRFALEAWAAAYQGELGTALADTYGSEAFFMDFDARYARLYDGLRQDSGDPAAFIERVVRHYQSLGIDPRAKTIVFSDNLTPELAVELQRRCGGRIRAVFGIGTNLTNDFEGSPALNIVIKLTAIDGIPVVKLTDDPAKASGDPEALRIARWTFAAEGGSRAAGAVGG
jgi:nicotinate phosphoribosyltransferase